jgi:hypothetical protein
VDFKELGWEGMEWIIVAQDRAKWSTLINTVMNLWVIRVIKIGRLRWLGHLSRTQELDPCRKLTLYKPEDTRRVGKPRARWLESVETDSKKMGIKNWHKAQDQEHWRTILKEAKVHQGL